MHRLTRDSLTPPKCLPIFQRHPHLEKWKRPRSLRGLPTGRMRKVLPIRSARHRPCLPLQRRRSGRRTAQRPHDSPAGQTPRMTTGHRPDRCRVSAERPPTRRKITRRTVIRRAVIRRPVRKGPKRERLVRRECIPALPPCSPSQWKVPTDAPVERTILPQVLPRIPQQHTRYHGKETRNVSDWHCRPGGFRHTA